MVIGERFVYGHIGKTGGDAVLTFFNKVPDVALVIDSAEALEKHDTFAERGVLDKEIVVLSFRRLASWELSYNREMQVQYGEERRPEHCLKRRADEMLSRFMEGVTVTHWLRMEHLREDFIAFASQIRPLTRREVAEIMGVETKRARRRKDEVSSFFSADQLRRIYELNPLWARTEQQVYGDTLLDRL